MLYSMLTKQVTNYHVVYRDKVTHEEYDYDSHGQNKEITEESPSHDRFLL